MHRRNNLATRPTLSSSSSASGHSNLPRSNSHQGLYSLDQSQNQSAYQSHHSPISTASTPLATTEPSTSFDASYFDIADASQLYHVSSDNTHHQLSSGLQRSLSIASTTSSTSSLHQGQIATGAVSLHPYITNTASNSSSSQYLSVPSSSVDTRSMSQHTLHRGASAETPQGFKCPNCSKLFARDDLLRRHLAREARAQAQPVVDRQKSCNECARSKSRCDLEVPSCGRCLQRGKTCVYGARSGNPNLQRSVRETVEPVGNSSAGDTSGSWSGSANSSLIRQSSAHSMHSSADESSDENRQAHQGTCPQHREARDSSISSISTSGSYDFKNQQQRSYDQNFGHRTASPSYYYYHHHHHQGSQPAAQSGEQIQRGYPTTSQLMDAGKGRAGVSNIPDEEGEVTPINRVNAASLLGTASTMGPPPQVTPGRLRDGTSSLGPSSNPWELSPSSIKAQRQSSTGQRPQPPRLLTGAKMPKPEGRSSEPQQGSARALFSAQIDLSCWLEEPVIPSPLYRMGPSLSALAPSLSGNTLLPQTPTNGLGTAEALRSALAASGPPLPLPMVQQSHSEEQSGIPDTIMNQQAVKVEKDENSQVAAKQWWAQTTEGSQSDHHIQQVAQTCAGHFTIYPALMVLPDPTSPVPPLFHRPWLAHTRLNTPASLARARVLLAGYHVKLPASEGMVWDMIAAETTNLVASFEQHLSASDLDIFSSTAALWFMIILLLMSSDPSSGAQIPPHLVDTSLIGLSRYSRLLCARIKACEERRRSMGGYPSFLQWGFEETMKRTLFASYSLLVLQRFRESSTEIQSQLAGIDIIIDIPLPATASEFEAASELEWRASHHVRIRDSPPEGGLDSRITIRDLLNARRTDGNTDENRKRITSYFDRHDDFTNVCLSVAFALDRNIP